MTIAPPSPDRRAAGVPALDRAGRVRGLLGLLARFGTVGLLAFVVDVAVFNLARHLLELGPLTSKTASVVIATTVAFVGNREWTFGERDRRPAAWAAVLFFVFNGVALLISLLCLAISTYGLGLSSPLAENVSTNVVGLGLGTVFRFWAYHRWVFPTRTVTSVHEYDDRPWGRWEVLDEGAGYKVKRITVQPHQRLSYQTHAQRSEHWFVVCGRATCVIDDATVVLTPGESVDIAVAEAHRIVNEESEVLEVIEVQLGAYTGEDDIQRLEDDFGRAG